MRTSPPNSVRAAFTLIELMVVMVIIAVMSAMVISEMGGSLQDALLRSSSRDIINIFSLASSRAISVNRQFRVRFDRGSGRYEIEKQGRGRAFVPATDVPGNGGALDPRIAIRVREPAADDEVSNGEVEANNAVNFYPDGTADAREIELRDRDGFGLDLRVSAITARVRVVELERQ